MILVIAPKWASKNPFEHKLFEGIIGYPPELFKRVVKSAMESDYVQAYNSLSMSDTNENYMGILLEQIRDQNQAVLEAVGDMQQHVAKIPAMAEQLERLEAKVDTVVSAVKATNADLADLDGRVARLEHAV